MKIIDEKGRLFGKINIIDFLVVIFLISLTPMFYFGYKIFNKNKEVKSVETKSIEIKEEPSKKFAEIEVDCLFIELNPQIAKLISVGDREIDKSGRVIGEITNIGRVSPHHYEFDIGAGKKIIEDNPVLKQIPVGLKINAEVRQDKIFYKDRQILDNSVINFITDKYQAEAILFFKDTSTSILNNVKQRIDALEKIEQRIDALEKKVDAILSSHKIKKLLKNNK